VNFSKFFPTELLKITNPITNSEGFLELGYLGAPYFTGIRTIIVSENSTLADYYSVNGTDTTYYLTGLEQIGQIVAPVFNGLDSLGEITIKDLDGDGAKNDYNDDVQVVGNGLPKFQFGWGNTFNFKGFYLNFFLRGVFGHYLVNVNNARYGVEGAVAVQNGMKLAMDYMDTGTPVFCDIHVEKADFVKLDNFSFGYNFNFKDSKYVSALTLYLSGQNLFTITNYSGVDPEVRYGDSYDNNNPLAPGIDRENTYFRTRSLTLGVNVTL
jgi:iron complex outermembrane receptor protein